MNGRGPAILALTQCGADPRPWDAGGHSALLAADEGEFIYTKVNQGNSCSSTNLEAVAASPSPSVCL